MSLQKFPGLIDIHVHLRDPGALQKEDFASGSRAAASGGFTFVCDMPNNYPEPTFTSVRLDDKILRSKEKSVIDIGFHFGTDGNNTDQFPYAFRHPGVFGLKIYCAQTTGNYVVSDPQALERIVAAWDSDKPILLHTDGDVLEYMVALAKTYKRRIHVCHVATAFDIDCIRRAKASGLPVTSGVTPHHLFLTDAEAKKLQGYGLVKPPLVDADTQSYLWEALEEGVIDIVESDHAPHTREEKEGHVPMYGFPGLETTLGLMLLSIKQKKLTLQSVLNLLYEHPRKIFSVPVQPDTFIEFDPDISYRAGQNGYRSKCGWSPFDGWELFGQVSQVVLRGIPLVRSGALV